MKPSKHESEELKSYKESQYRLRKAIGVLGIFLPIILFFSHDVLLPSMSHYYYTEGGVFFIAILATFGIVLIAYKGHSKSEKNTIFKDGIVTTLAGISILIAVIIPTSSKTLIGKLYYHGDKNYLNGHYCSSLSTIHLVAAGLFLFFLGFMCVKKFTLNKEEKYNTLYKVCGYIVYVCVGFMFVIMLINKIFETTYLNTTYYVFWLESIAVWAFGLAWLLKGKIDRPVKKLYNRMKYNKNETIK